MKLKDGKISILFNHDGLSIEVIDSEASTTFAKIHLTPKQTIQAMSRLAHTPCSIEVFGLDKVGKKMENKHFEFLMPEHTYSNSKEIAIETVKNICPEGWIPDFYFDSRGSFFIKNSKKYARCTIRRWI